MRIDDLISIALAAGDKAMAKCEKIKDAKLKAQCMKDVSKQK